MKKLRTYILVSISFLFAAPLASLADRKQRFELVATKVSTLFIAESDSDVTSIAIADGIVLASGGETGEPYARLIDPVSGADLMPPFPLGTQRFTGGIHVASGDLDGDGEADIVFAPGAGSAPDVSIYSKKGEPKATFSAFASSFTGGVSVATGDIDGDGVDELITASNGIVRARSGTRFAVVAQFQPYGPAFTDGPAVAAADMDGDGRDEIITSPLTKGGAVRAFTTQDRILEVFPFGFTSESGTSVSAGDIDGDGRAEIVVASTRKSRIKAISSSGATVLELQPTYRGGVTVSVADVDGDGVAEIVTAGKMSRGKRRRRKLVNAVVIFEPRPRPSAPNRPKSGDKGRREKGPRAVDFSPAIP